MLFNYKKCSLKPYTRSLTENSQPYCEQSEFGHFLSCFSLNRTTIRLKTPQKTGSNQIALATGAILGQSPRLFYSSSGEVSVMEVERRG